MRRSKPSTWFCLIVNASTAASPLVVFGIAGLSLLLLIAWPALLARTTPNDLRTVFGFAGTLAAWALLWWVLAAAGVLAQIERRPPPFALLPPALVAAVFAVTRSRVGDRLAETPLWLLVGLQSFRLPLELVMHVAAREGVMPPQMTFGSWQGATGYNYDVVTGVSALLLAAALRRCTVPRSLVLAWNTMGLLLVVVIMTVGVASTPLFARFGHEPERLNTWVLFPPFVWLPAVLVGSALLGHALTFRQLAASKRSPLFAEVP